MQMITAIIIAIIALSSTNIYAGEDDLYDFLWLDPDKTVYVLQNKVHPKAKKLYLDIGYVSSLSSKFQDTNGAQFNIGYYHNEDWGIELSYVHYGNSDNTAFESVQIINGQVPFIRRPISSVSIFAMYSPFYGKINTFNRIFYFDWSFGVGTGVIKMESNLDSVLDPSVADSYEVESYSPIQFKSKIKFHVNKRFHIGAEVLNTNYQAGNPSSPTKKSWKSNNDIVIGLGVSF